MTRSQDDPSAQPVLAGTGAQNAQSWTRRQLLGAATAGLGGAALPGGLWARGALHALPSDARPLLAGHDDRRLVLLFLEGGNDGLNTVIPTADDAYHRARPQLALRGESLHPLDDVTALHPSLSAWRRLFDEGHLGVWRGVGMERPNRSHFVARDVWHSGYRDVAQRPSGWVGRALDDSPRDSLPGVGLGVAEAPLILTGERRVGLTLQDGDRLTLQGPARRSLLSGDGAAGSANGGADFIARVAAGAYDLSVRWEDLLAGAPGGTGYPDTELGDRLRLAARLARAPAGPAAVWCTLGGFDTHAIQAGTHAALLEQLGRASAAFIDDLARDGTDGRVTLLVYSEFGRRVTENGSRGTDHGAAAPVFALGGAVQGGLFGEPPDLATLLDGDVAPSLDFRAVFGAAAEWMGWNAQDLFGAELESLGLAKLFH